MKKALIFTALCTLAAGCSRLEEVGKTPDFKPALQGNEHFAMSRIGIPETAEREMPFEGSSLWRNGRKSLLGNQRAQKPGDIVTVVIEIDDRAEISNSSNRSRSGSESLAVPQLLGIPQRINQKLPEGASLDNAVSTNSSSASSGDGSVSRNEKLTLRVAATVVEVLQNGVLSVQG